MNKKENKKTWEMTEDSTLRESSSKHIEWRIAAFFESPMEVDFKIDSYSFSFSQAKWYLRIFPNGEFRYRSAGWIALYLVRESSEGKHHVGYRIGIRKADGSEQRGFYSEYTFNEGDSEFGWLKAVERSALVKEDYAPDDSLTVFCNIHILDGQVTLPTTETASQTESPDGVTTLSEKFKDLYLKGCFTDTTMTVKGREFLVHKFILASRSSVFTAMFDHDMAEKNSGKVEIIDCDPDIFEQFLLFLYTGKLDVVPSSNPVELYALADRYDVQELKEECSLCMIRELSIDSFCNVIHLAVMQNELDLLNSATDFFIDNADKILLTPKWNSFLEENPAFGNELFLKFLNFMKSKQ